MFAGITGATDTQELMEKLRQFGTLDFSFSNSKLQCLAVHHRDTIIVHHVILMHASRFEKRLFSCRTSDKFSKIIVTRKAKGLSVLL